MSEALKLDLRVGEWTLAEQMEYRRRVKVNPQYAVAFIIDAFTPDENGDIRRDVYNIPPEYLLGIAWVTMRRDSRALTYDDVLAKVKNYDELLEAVSDVITASLEQALAESEQDEAEDEAEDERPTGAGTDDPAQTTT